MLFYQGHIVPPPHTWNSWPVDYVLVACTAITGMTRPQLTGKTHDVVARRDQFCAALHEYTSLSYPEIATVMRAPYHSAAHAACRRFRERKPREEQEAFFFRVLLECFRLRKSEVKA